MPNYLVESYLPKQSVGELATLEARGRLAAASIARTGMPVSYLRCTFVPEDELCLFLFEAPSLDVAYEAARRARIPYERIVEAIDARVKESR